MSINKTNRLSILDSTVSEVVTRRL